MARHSFIQMSKLSDVKGRISYISDPKRQEHLYATFSTREKAWCERLKTIKVIAFQKAKTER